MRRTKGFTLVELLVVIAIIAILATLLVPAVRRAVELANQASCRANLSGIGKGIALYAAEDKNAKFPLLWNSGDPESAIIWSDAAKDIGTLTTDLVSKPAGMQNMWLMIDRGLVPDTAFGCPSDDDYMARNLTTPAERLASRVGWQSSAQFSYGLHYPYKFKTTPDPAKPGVGGNPAPLGPKLKSGFVIMADKSPHITTAGSIGVQEGITEPSNHVDDGEVYLTYSGQVDIKKSLADSNVQGDDIYTISTNLPTGITNKDSTTPAWRDDQYITPHPLEAVNPNP